MQRPSRRRLTRPATFNVARCCETAGCEMSKREVRSFTAASPRVSDSRIARRLGSASAWKILFSAAVCMSKHISDGLLIVNAEIGRQGSPPRGRRWRRDGWGGELAGQTGLPVARGEGGELLGALWRARRGGRSRPSTAVLSISRRGGLAGGTGVILEHPARLSRPQSRAEVEE